MLQPAVGLSSWEATLTVTLATPLSQSVTCVARQISSALLRSAPLPRVSSAYRPEDGSTKEATVLTQLSTGALSESLLLVTLALVNHALQNRTAAFLMTWLPWDWKPFAKDASLSVFWSVLFCWLFC